MADKKDVDNAGELSDDQPTPEEPYDAGDPKHVKAQRSKAKLAEANDQNVLRQLLATNLGRRWYYRHLVSCHVFQSSFSTNAMQMAFAEGERNVGLRLVADMMVACPERYLEMLKEAENG